ncbi:ATP-binding protein [Oxalobacteraceae bacterium OTU3CINTB1]|nr:ATP-binding protein [Oxalobacteraceae bacterium OTU3CINTB1]
MNRLTDARDSPVSPPGFAPGGVMAARVAAHDWGATPLGPIEGWPPALRITANLVLASHFPSCLVWGEHKVMIYNDAFCPILGRKPDALGRSFQQVWEEVWDSLDPIWALTRQGRSTFIEDYPLVVNRSGASEQAYFTFCYSPVFDEHGHIVGMLDTVIETTEKVQAMREAARFSVALEDELNALTQDRDRIWQLSSDLMLLLDADDAVAAINPAFTRTLGWKEGELSGRPFITLVHPAERDQVAARVALIRAAAASSRLEIQLRHKDGHFVYIVWTSALNGNYLLGIGRDSTAERAAAAVLKRTEAALQHAQKMEAIGKLTGGVAHDFNNLLQIISGNLQLLSAVLGAGHGALRYVERALAGVTRGAKLASYLLAFSRRQALEPEVARIDGLLAGMDDMLRRTLDGQVDIETRIGDGLWHTFVDTAQLENAVLNLCINARDAMDGSGKLTIVIDNAVLDDDYARAHVEVAAGEYVMIAVGDTGSGMPPEVLQRAFDPFFSTKAEGKGTGLGLSMVFGFVKQSGGHVSIASEVGAGTTVRLYLPRCPEAAAEAAPAAGEGEGEPALAGGGETVLVVEDNDAVRDIAVEMLGELGYTVLEAPDAVGAMEIVDSGVPIDLLFTDVIMPGPLRSPELARRARSKLPGLAVLFTSGYAENAIVHDGRLDPGLELLGKPYTRQALARKIRLVLERARA